MVKWFLGLLVVGAVGCASTRSAENVPSPNAAWIAADATNAGTLFDLLGKCRREVMYRVHFGGAYMDKIDESRFPLCMAAHGYYQRAQ